ncbi:MAG: hypothetical protein FJ115_03600 [Deltaproteobacteria bacterium]|nr:hypothetical protein [Deltaproteobacteria bacterium]
MEKSETEVEYQRAEGETSLCPHCKKPLPAGQPLYLSNYWIWNDNTKRLERDESGQDTDEVFCTACRAEYRDSLYR